MRKHFLLFLFPAIVLLAGSCFGKTDSSSSGSSREKVSVPAKPRVDMQRELINSKLRNKALGLYVYKSYEIESEDFELNDLEGQPVSLEDFKGRVVFLNFWATWCGPCRAEMPAMERVYRSLRDTDFVMLSVNLREDKKSVRSFMSRSGLTFPVLLDTRGKVADLYGASNIPTTYLLDRKGYFVAGAAGTREWDSPEFMEIFKLLLAEND